MDCKCKDHNWIVIESRLYCDHPSHGGIVLVDYMTAILKRRDELEAIASEQEEKKSA